MALSFEESKKQLSQLASTPMMMSMARDIEPVAAYSNEDWTIDDTYPWFNEFYDDKISFIDENKNITVDSSQVNISQEVNSQFIPFEMMQHYDGFNLAEMAITIHYTRSDGTHGTSSPVNVKYNGEKLRFVWRVDGLATCIPGKMIFEVHADGIIADSKGNIYPYVWKSKSTDKFNIVKSLCYDVDDCDIKIDIGDPSVQNIITEVVAKVTDKIVDVNIESQVSEAGEYARQAEESASKASSAATEVVSNALSNYSTTEEMESYVGEAIKSADISSQLENYALKSEVPSIDGLATETYVDEAIKAVDVSEQLADYALAEDVDIQVSKIHDRLDDEYYTKAETNEVLQPYATTKYVDDNIASIDVSDKLKDYALKSELPNVPTNVSAFTNDAGYLTEHQSLEGYATEQYVQEEIKKVDVSEQLKDYALKSEVPSIEGLATEDYVNSAVDAVDVSGQLVDYAKSADVYTKSEIDTTTNSLSSSIITNTTNLTSLSDVVGTLQTTVNGIDKSPRLTYDIAYNDAENPDVGENGFVLYEIANEGIDGEVKTVKSKVIITGGGGGSTASTTLKIERITSSPLTITTSDKALIEYNVSSVDADGETVDCSYTWKKGSSIIASGSCSQGKNVFDATEFVSVGTHKFTLTVTDEGGAMSVKTWTVQMVDVRIETSFSDQVKYAADKPISFTYTPYGAVEKVIHFKLDGKELDPVTTTVSGILQSYQLPAQPHGAHLLEVWVTAIVNDVEVEPTHIYKDIIWFDETSDIPVIGCIYRYDHYGVVSTRQYNATDITYVVYDANAVNATVNRYVDGESIGAQTLEKYVDVWSYKTADIGEKTLKIECGPTSVEIEIDVAELGITIEPVTAGLAFDFNPTGRSNNDEDRVWSDENTGVAMSVSKNFDWVNGGYQRDENGDQYFCVKAGTMATINYNLFGADYDPKATGKEFKFVFKTTSVKKRSSTFLSCIEQTTAEDGAETYVGINMTVENANIYARNKNIFIPYSEEDIIEFEFNINKDTDIPLLMTYEDGVANRPLIYASDSSFMQIDPMPIVIGSDDCDVHVYRMKAYDTSLSDKEILSNFIADARNADEMIARYERNDIYDENGALTPEVLAEKCPDLRIIMIDAPWFTNDKDDKVSGTTVRQIYKGGDPVYDNWTCTGAKHSGQGTSSNKYGYAGRNLRLIMNEDESLFTFNGTDESGNPITGKEVKLGKDSVPNAFWNIKVNIASSENQNNAQFAKRYNEFNPFVRAAKAKNPNVKDTMEFYNCVVFIRENESDLSKHREFNDTSWHFYAIGNVGDDKKTDKSRVNDSKDPKECVVEIMDYDVPLAEFPTGIGGDYIAPSEWKAGNTAYDNLYSEYTYDEDGKFKGFGAESYEFRYEMKGITDEQRQGNIDAWRDFYKFVVTSTDEEFVANFENYFVLDSALYAYLFTERYLMVDNRAKNSFWHRGRVYITQAQFVEMGEEKAKGYIVDDTKASINEGYRWDLTFGYDFDTSLGISNTGQLVLTYGQEDVDKYANGEYLYRAAESNFFCRIRDLFTDQLKGVFQSRESLRAWSANDLIKQWDDAQSQFPEELWRIDVERKYIRTYRGVSIDNSIAGAQDPTFLEPMLNGRKKYQRRQIERNNELYFATKYVSTFAKDDFIRMRFTKPEDVAITPDYTLYLTPFTDMYITAEFGNTAPIIFRAKAGIEYPVVRKTESDTADIVLIYGASFIQAIGDLSKCYLREGNFSKATRLQSLTIGSNLDGYKNESLTQLALDNNKLLEYLDIRQATELKTVIDLSKCNNLVELHAEGSGVTGVIFANGGKLEKAYLPSITSLTMKNLQYVDVFNVSSYSNLQQLIVENTPAINTYSVVNSSPLLNTVRLVGINWDESYNIPNTTILNRILKMRGIDADGYTVPTSVLTGYFYASIVKEKELLDYNNQWKFLTINQGTLVEQFAVTFMNDDGTVLDVQYVDKGTKAVDPITRTENPIATPTKESTISTNYTFAGWDKVLVDAFDNQVITATYSESTREYTVKYMSKGTILQETTAKYGTTVLYDGNLPTYTIEESAYKYYLFDGWNQSGYVNGDKTIDATFDSCSYVNGYFENKDLKDMRPVEIYMMLQLDKAKVISLKNCVVPKDSIKISLGNDFSYSDVEEVVLISEKTIFDGTNEVDTGIKLLSEDRDFVLAIDCSMDSGNVANAVLAQCFSGRDTSGFKLSYSNGVKMSWGSAATTASSVGNRDMIVVRHVKGDNGLHVYSSNTSGTYYSYVKLDGVHTMSHNVSLVFGCGKLEDGSYEDYGKGTVYWSKLWYADLGQDVCERLACWPHEEIGFDACFETNGNPKRYYLSNDSGLSSLTFIASNVLSQSRQMSSASTNAGGWAVYPLNTYLNTRVYEAFPDSWKQLMKQVIVKSSIGNKSLEISDSNCYVFIPSISELGYNVATAPYDSEGTQISHMTTNTARTCDNKQYWTRSPSTGWTNYVYSITGTGTDQAVTQLSTKNYIRMMISI